MPEFKLNNITNMFDIRHVFGIEKTTDIQYNKRIGLIPKYPLYSTYTYSLQEKMRKFPSLLNVYQTVFLSIPCKVVGLEYINSLNGVDIYELIFMDENKRYFWRRCYRKTGDLDSPVSTNQLFTDRDACSNYCNHLNNNQVERIYRIAENYQEVIDIHKLIVHINERRHYV